MPETRLLTHAQVARQWGVKPDYILRLIHRRRLAAVKVGRFWRIEPQAVEAYITDHRQDAVLETAGAVVDDRQLPLGLDEPARLTLAEEEAYAETVDR